MKLGDGLPVNIGPVIDAADGSARCIHCGVTGKLGYRMHHAEDCAWVAFWRSEITAGNDPQLGGQTKDEITGREPQIGGKCIHKVLIREYADLAIRVTCEACGIRSEVFIHDMLRMSRDEIQLMREKPREWLKHNRPGWEHLAV